MAQLEFRCEKCGKLLRVHAGPGDNVVCNHCGQMVVAPNVVAKPRPTPQVANGTRPQPAPAVAMAGGGAAVAAVPEELDAQEDDSLLAAMSFLMPWALSIVFHIGLLLVLLFLMTGAGMADTDLEEIHVPSNKWSDDPGVQQPDKNTSDEVAKIQNVDLTKPAPEVTQNIQTTEQPIVAIADSSNVSGMMSAFAGEAGKGSSFFGTRAGGNTRRIIFVVDRSGSMNKHFDFVKGELSRSIGELGPMQEFTILFYNDEAKPLEMRVNNSFGLVRATRANITAAREWIMGQTAYSREGKTFSASAFQRAFQLMGNEEHGLIWLLSEGHIHDEPDKILARLNSSKRVVVNTIGFVERVAEQERLMQRIAAENGGSYKFVSEADLGR